MSNKYLPEGQLLYGNKNVNRPFDKEGNISNNILQSIEKNINVKNDDIAVSVYCTSKRDYLWKWLYDTLSMNTIKFELVITSPFYPDFELPKNFKFIHSITKPVQSLQLAAINCSGETMQCLSDDCYSKPNSLDLLYKKYKEKDDYKHTIIPNFFEPPINTNTVELIENYSKTIDIYNNTIMRMAIFDNDSLPAHAGGLISRKFFNELGGYDNRFIMRFADLDLQMRAFAEGGTYEFYQDVWIAEMKEFCKSDAIYQSAYDYSTFLNLWFLNSSCSKDNILSVRNGEFQPFIDDGTLHEKSQGAKDKWD